MASGVEVSRFGSGTVSNSLTTDRRHERRDSRGQ